MAKLYGLIGCGLDDDFVEPAEDVFIDGLVLLVRLWDEHSQ